MSFNFMAAVTTCSDFGAQETSLSRCPLFSRLYILFKKLFESKFGIRCPFTLKYFIVYFLKERTFSYIVTV